MLAATEQSTTANVYRLRCTDCSFETTVNGDSYDALKAAAAHQGEYGESSGDHFVNFEVNERS